MWFYHSPQQVEKWLLQVEKQMIQSLRDIIAKAVPAYYSTEFGDWIHQWPGQVTHTGRAINWTAQVI